MIDGNSSFWTLQGGIGGNDPWWPWRGTHAGFNQAMLDATLPNTFPMSIVLNDIYPALVDDSANDAFLTPDVSQTSPTQTLIADLYDDTDTIHAPTVAVGLSPSLVVDADAFFGPTVIPGDVT